MIVAAARRSQARRLEITGMRGAHRLSDGTLLEESASIGQRRAEEVAGLLGGAGVNVATGVDRTGGRAEADGIDDWRSQRVTVVVEPRTRSDGPEEHDTRSRKDVRKVAREPATALRAPPGLVGLALLDLQLWLAICGGGRPFGSGFSFRYTAQVGI